MDPNQVWSDLSVAVERNDWQEAEELAHQLAGWIAGGGFPPAITGKEAFDRIVARAAIHVTGLVIHRSVAVELTRASLLDTLGSCKLVFDALSDNGGNVCFRGLDRLRSCGCGARDSISKPVAHLRRYCLALRLEQLLDSLLLRLGKAGQVELAMAAEMSANTAEAGQPADFFHMQQCHQGRPLMQFRSCAGYRPTAVQALSTADFTAA